MASAGFTELAVKTINRDTPRILLSVTDLTKDVRMLSSFSSSKFVESRHLLQRVREITNKALRLKGELARLDDLRSKAKRSHLGDNFGSFASSYQGNVKRIGKEFDKLGRELQRLDRLANNTINQPGRHGDASAGGPVLDLIGFLTNIVSIFDMTIGQKKNQYT